MGKKGKKKDFSTKEKELLEIEKDVYKRQRLIVAIRTIRGT